MLKNSITNDGFEVPVIIPHDMDDKGLITSGFCFVTREGDEKGAALPRYRKPLLPLPPFGDEYEGYRPNPDERIICACYEQAMVVVATGLVPPERTFYRDQTVVTTKKGNTEFISKLKELDENDLEIISGMSSSELKELIWEALDYFVEDEEAIFA